MGNGRPYEARTDRRGGRDSCGSKLGIPQACSDKIKLELSPRSATESNFFAGTECASVSDGKHGSLPGLPVAEREKENNHCTNITPTTPSIHIFHSESTFLQRDKLHEIRSTETPSPRDSIQPSQNYSSPTTFQRCHFHHSVNPPRAYLLLYLLIPPVQTRSDTPHN